MQERELPKGHALPKLQANRVAFCNAAAPSLLSSPVDGSDYRPTSPQPSYPGASDVTYGNSPRSQARKDLPRGLGAAGFNPSRSESHSSDRPYSLSRR